jgi:hypothetical protein
MPPELFTNPDDLEVSRRPLTPEQADKLPHVHRLLLGYYGEPKPREPWDPLTQLIYSLLSSRTKTPASHQVMRDLERTFTAGTGNWEPVRDASVPDIERAIAIVTFPEQKALRLKALLEQITARVGTLTLEFLAKYRTDKIRTWLEQFEGSATRSLPPSSTSPPSAAEPSASTPTISASPSASASPRAPTPPPPKNASCASSPKPGTPQCSTSTTPSSSSTPKPSAPSPTPSAKTAPSSSSAPPANATWPNSN